MKRLVPLLFLLSAATARTAAADDIPWCSTEPIDRFQYLRRLSLDLRQRAPDLAEYEALASLDDVPDATVDAFLSGRDFQTTVRAYHRELLWPNLRGALMFNALAQLTPAGGAPNGALFVVNDERSVVYRGRPQGQSCADRQQTAFEPDGTPIPGSDGLDGWVTVEPYWAPGTQVKVCAYEAQAKLVASDVDTSGNPWEAPCHAMGSYISKRCGCGPRLAFCNFGSTRNLMRDGFIEQMLRLVDDVVLNDRPYTEVLTTREADVNGPVAHYLRWQWGYAAELLMTPDGNWSVPELPFGAKDDWRRVERGPSHAGLLTLPAYLLKFQTNRSRAHRFHNAFLCQPFEPPPGGLQLVPTTEEDVAKRPGCSYCHQTLEPAAAYWGRFVEQGATWLDPADHPVEYDACRNQRWTNDPLLRNTCLRAYIWGREPRGVLRAYEFARDGSPEAEQLARHAEIGPRGFAEAIIFDGRFARCTVRKWWRHLLRREPTEAELEGDIRRLASDFSAGGYRLKSLIRAIVTSRAYRSSP